MKKIILLATILSIQVSFAQDYMDYASIRANELSPEKTNFQKMVHRSQRPWNNSHARYEPYTTNKHYSDCSYYYDVNCEDVRFSECYQCRMYTYVVNPPLPHGYHFENVKNSN